MLLITGPAGSGKSTVARRVSEELGWECISEDAYWVRNGWGAGLRSAEYEQVVQAQVGKDLLAVSGERGRSAVLEFILYKDPPNPLTAYQELLSNSLVAFNTVVLKPSVDEILRRIQERGRPNDLRALELRRPEAEHQVQCLETKHIDPGWVIDSTGLSIDEVVHRCVDLAKSES
ncbi:MAG: AAA family ATPase [Chloroflexi bacterium]|nr:AAA family ATPase [Chloroflexota bacterium]